MIYQLHTSPFWQKDEDFFFKTVYKPNLAKTVYISVLHFLMYKNKTVKSISYTKTRTNLSQLNLMEKPHVDIKNVEM